MKFLDSLKIALHNLWHNKSRTILTFVIVFCVSILIMTILFFAISFADVQNDILKRQFEVSGTTHTLSRQEKITTTNDRYVSEEKNITKDEYDLFNKTAEKHDSVVNTMYMVPNKNNVSLAGFNTGDDYGYSNSSLTYTPYNFKYKLSAKDGYIKEGSVWSEADKDKNYVWLSTSTVETLVKQYGINAKVNSEIEMTFGDLFTHKMIVKGIFEIDNAQTNNYFYYRGNAMSICVSADWIMSKVTAEQLEIYSLNCEFIPHEGYTYSKANSEMKKFVKEINNNIEQSTYNGKVQKRCFSTFLFDNMMMLVTISIILILCTVISLIILLISIGSVTNTIIISVNKNKKFIGLMKAMGLNTRGLKGIVTKETIIQVIGGILLSTIVLLCLSSLMTTIMSSLFASMGLTTKMLAALGYTLKVVFPWYLPLIVVVLFAGFALFFSRKSVNRIAQADAISIISEVS